MKTYTDSPYLTLTEETPGALTGKEGYLLELGTAAGTVKLAASGENAIGVMHRKLEGDDSVSVRLLGKGGTVKVKAGGVIAKGDRVIWGTGGKVITQTLTAGTYRTLGRNLSQGNSASGDIIEILDVIERVTIVA